MNPQNTGGRGAASDRPYETDEAGAGAPVPRPAGKDPSTPPDAHTEIDSEADIGDPAGQ